MNLPDILKACLEGQAQLEGRVAGSLTSPRLTWRLVGGDLAYNDPEFFRRPLPLKSAKGELVVANAAPKSMTITADAAGLPVEIRFTASDGPATPNQVTVSIGAGQTLQALRRFVPVNLLGRYASDAMRQMRRGNMKVATAKATCAASAEACMQGAGHWRFAEAEAKFSNLLIAPLPRAPAFAVSTLVARYKDDKLVVDVIRADEKALNRLTQAHLVASGPLDNFPQMVTGTISGKISLPDVLQIVAERVPAIAELGIDVSAGRADGKVNFVWSPEKAFERIEATLDVSGGAGKYAAVGAFRDAGLKAKGLALAGAPIRIELESLNDLMGDAWSLSGAGTIAVDGDVVKPNLAIRAIVAPRIVSQFLNDTGGVKWTGGNLNADVHISGDNVKRHPPVTLARVPPHDVAQRRVGLHGRGIHPDALALHQTRLGDQRQDPVKHRRVDFMGQAARVRDSQEWSGTRSRISNSRNSRSDRESEQRHSSPRSESIPSK